MHDLIEQMGREIVRQESIKDPGRRSRLSNTEDVYNVLNNDKGTESVQGIVLNMSEIKRDLHLHADTFKRMPYIRFLKFYHSGRGTTPPNVYVASALESFPNELRYLEWCGCPVKSLPPAFCAEKLVELSMPRSKVSKLWNGVQDLVNLKRINLNECWELVELPDFTKASNLEEVYLKNCVSLCEVHPSILSSHKLGTLNVYGCKELKSLKGEIHLKSLTILDVRNCSNLKEFSVSSEELTSLDFHWTVIYKLHSSVSRLSKLVEFDLYGVRIEALPDQLCLLVSLEKLNLEGCKQLIELPQNMKALSRLQHLNIADCCSLRSLPELSPSIIHLSANNCTSLEKFFNAKAVLSLNLVSISFENCVRLDDDDSFLEYVHHPMMGVAVREMLGWMVERSFTHSSSRYVYDPSIFYPGSKVPSWFKYQTGRSSVAVELLVDEPHYLDRLVGFILCCVVHHIPSQRGAPQKQPPMIQCRCGDLWLSKRSAETSGLSSDHVCIWFERVGGEHGLHDKIVTFNFKTYYRSWASFFEFKEAWEVIGCGVCPVYASDVLDAFQNVDAEFKFFYDRGRHEWLDLIEASVFTIDQVKTLLIHKMEQQNEEDEKEEEEEVELWSQDSYPFDRLQILFG